MKVSVVEIDSPERIKFRYRPAESATRAAATIVDSIVQLALLLALSAPLIAWGDTLRESFLALFIFGSFLVQWGYGFFFETLLSGRTPGKLLLKIRVIRSDGEALDAKSIAIRNLLRAADGLPFMLLPALGGFVTVFDPKSRRIGDIVGGTLVVYDGRQSLRRPPAHDPVKPYTAPELELSGGARLDERELYILRRFLLSSGSLPMARSRAVAASLAEKAAARLGIAAEGEAEAWLAALYAAHGPSRSVRFTAERLPDWVELERLLDAARVRGASRLGPDALTFATLFRATCADLAEARGSGFSEDVVEYLNALAGEARALVYSAPPYERGALRKSIVERIPAQIAASWRFLLVSAALFGVPFATTFALTLAAPHTAARFVDPLHLESMLEAYSSIEFDGRSDGSTAYMIAFYIRNNVSIDFMCLATGALFGAGPAFLLVENGFSLGGVLGYVSGNGRGEAIGRFIAAHAPLELTGMVMAGAGGLLLGWTMLSSRRGRRLADFRASLERFVPLAACAGVLTFAAAFVEAGIGLSSLGIAERLAIAGSSIAAMLAYFVAFPLLRRRKGATP